MTTIHAILEKFHEAATSNRNLGDKFERLVPNYLVAATQYKEIYSDVWLLGE